MLVKNLDFFKQFLDDSTIKAYITLAKSEEQDDYDLNCYIMYMQLKKFFKLAKNDNFNYSFYLTFNSLIYRLNCLCNFIEKDPQLEEAFLLSKRFHNLKKECLKKLKKHLLNQDPFNLKNSDISKVFLYIIALNYKIDCFNKNLEKCLNINNMRTKYINVTYHNTDDIDKNINDINYITEEIKILTKKAL